MTTLEEDIDRFLEKAKRSEFWRAIELQEELGLRDDRHFEMKSILEGGVDNGKYERKIVQKKKIWLVGYRLKLDDEVPEEAILQPTEKGWERKER